MKKVSTLFSLLFSFVLPLLASTETVKPVDRLYTLVPAELKTVEIVEMDGNQIKDFPTQRILDVTIDEFDVKPHELTPDEFKTLEIIDMDGNQVKDFRTQRILDSRKDEFLGLYVIDSDRVMYVVARPIGGKPIKFISWQDNSVNGKRSMQLNGRTVSEYFRDEQNHLKAAIEARQQTNRENKTADGSSSTSPLAKADAMTLFTKWSVKNGVSATYISKEMFRMMEKTPQIELNRPVDLTPFIKTLDGLYMLEFAKDWEAHIAGSNATHTQRYERSTQSGGLRKDIQDYLAGKRYQLLMEKRNGELVTRLYIAGDDKIVTGFVLVRMDVDYDYGQFVCIEGKIPRDKFEAIIANGMK